MVRLMLINVYKTVMQDITHEIFLATVGGYWRLVEINLQDCEKNIIYFAYKSYLERSLRLLHDH